MKKSKAFSLTEILIATMFMGIIASLTIPSTIESLKYREHVTAYKNSFEKIQQAVSLAGITDSSWSSAHKLYATLNDSLPVVGYTNAGIENGSIARTTPVVTINASTLAEKATWGEGDGAITVGSKTGSTITAPNGYSPWIVTENNLAFTLSTQNADPNSCATVSNIFHSGALTGDSHLANKASFISCATIIVDINGLNKGPNKLASYDELTEGEAREEVKGSDRFLIYVGVDGVSAGPEKLVSYWMMKNK